MTQEQEPIKIVVEDEPTYRPERPNSDITTMAGQVGQTLHHTAKQAWESETRKKVTQEVQKGVTAVSHKGYELVRDKVVKTAEQQTREQAAALQNRLRHTDWKKETKTGAVKGLKWLSAKLTQLANKLSPNSEP